jgi:hypothetical protein
MIQKKSMVIVVPPQTQTNVPEPIRIAQQHTQV